jgi:hypothetical protein
MQLVQGLQDIPEVKDKVPCDLGVELKVLWVLSIEMTVPHMEPCR